MSETPTTPTPGEVYDLAARAMWPHAKVYWEKPHADGAITAAGFVAMMSARKDFRAFVDDVYAVAVQAGREAAARDIETTIIAGQRVPALAFPGGTPTAEGLRTWAAAIARGDA